MKKILLRVYFFLRKLLKSKENLELELEIVTIRNIDYRLLIHAMEQKAKRSSITQALLRSALYLILIGSFLIMFIRAIRYEN